MALFNASVLIKELRTAQGLTQEQLAEGICSRQTITNIERGDRKPDWFTFKSLMLRLGQAPEKYHADITSGDDAYLIQKLNKCSEYLQVLNFEALKKEMDLLEMDEKFTGGKSGNLSLGRFLILRHKAGLHLDGPYKDVELSLKCIMECLHNTRPNFDISEIPNYFLGPEEYPLINQLAIAYKELEGLPKAIEVWQLLKANYEKHYAVNIHINTAYRDLCVNIALALKHSERYEECLEIVEENTKLALQHHDMRIYSRCLHQKAFGLMKLGREEEGKDVYKKFLMFAYVLDGYAAIDFAIVKKEYEDLFGGKLDLTAPW